jgi:hypothetical protein
MPVAAKEYQKIKEEFSKETHTEEIKNQTEPTYTTQCR